ncbi:uncharacterized protein LOC133887429 [Phragmites australis]|uniref:uncharacterized protein LOC133887429 n=1 Tax=Phragmites australis TaxID=29695 RepID=UPI002D78FE7C|nr:uncharacterized protein LOC133887429 [Phragmites australis]
MQKKSGKKSAGCGAGAAKKARTSTKEAKLDAVQGKEGETFLTFSMDPDVLECPICFVPFAAEVYTCRNGHGACANCCIRINRKCWCCSEPIGDFRNRQLENVLAAMITPCNYKKFGCGVSVKYTDKRSHEETCPYAPYECPFDGCSYSGLLLCHHVRREHPPDAVYDLSYVLGTTVTLHKDVPFLVLLQPSLGLVFLLLNGGDVLAGRSLSLLCLGPRSHGDVDLEYRMEVNGAEPGALSLSASGTVPCARRLGSLQAKGFLFVPDAYWGPSGCVSVKVSV